jgi:hypothetical protein
MIRAGKTDDRSEQARRLRRVLAGVAIAAGSMAAASSAAGAATTASGDHGELCWLVDLYVRAEPGSTAKFRLHEQIEQLLPW